MGSLIKIGLAGSYKCDLLLYIACVANATGKKVAIIDATTEKEMEYTTPRCFDNTVVTYNNVDVHLDCNDDDTFKKVNFNQYDIVFIDYGFNVKLAADMSKCDMQILVTNIEKSSIMRLSGFVKALAESISNSSDSVGQVGIKKDMIKIYRDVIDSKITTKYTDSLLNISDKINIAMEYIVYLNEQDYKCRIETEYNDIFKFNKITKAYKNMIIDIIEGSLGLARKEIIKAFKKAERGL